MATVNPTHLCQLLIEVSDLSRAKGFYEEVFGWKAVPADLFEMIVLEVPPECPFGIALVPRDATANPPPSLSPSAPPGGLKAIFAVDDPIPIVDQCRGWEGCQVTGPRTHPGYGLVWNITDPDGLTWGLFQRS
jgi:predicted enzyme related to lactoylglutathione lyase